MGRGLIQRQEHMQRPPFPHTMKNEAYPVLAVVSNRYSEPSGRSSTRYSPVRRFTWGRSPFLARLACVRHAASVQSEPESNSPIKIIRDSALSLRPKRILLFANADFLPLLAIYLSKNRKTKRKGTMHSQKKIVNKNFDTKISRRIFHHTR